ncbi:MAG TPA: alpha-amylase family glycosyl hydrolase, partial [Bacteroidales bacterium]|nr:alpha-amylase family glycosyl hydrolase [Bacteroidales bacterium]
MITNSALKILFIQLYLLFSLSAISQVVTTEPPLPFDNKPVTVYFDATQGDQGLMNFTGDVYAHTGVLTDKSQSDNDWKYVKAEWTTNIPECKLTRISTNLYSLDISPSIREFYGVPASEKIVKMCFVFRNSDGSKTGRDDGGKDIFTDVFEEGLNVSFINPSKYFTLLEDGESVPVEISATASDSIALFLDNNWIASDTGTTLIDTVQFTGNTTHIAVTRAYKDGESKADTAYFLIKSPVQTEPLPAGMQDGINYIDDNTVTLVLYAPRKTNVYLLGDMNNWTPDNSYQLKKDGDRFWITMNGLTKGKEYGYQYMVDDSLLIGDPYADKVLDPWNDQYISQETYPNLKPYPAGKTQGIVTVFQTGQQEYVWKNKDFIPPANEDLVIYELLIRDFTEQHTYQSLIDTINYLDRLGINAIELMPINEFEGNESWGYNPDYYFAPDKYYGPKNDLKAFIDTCHGRGIAVIQDMVLNHSYGLSPLVQLYFDPTAGDYGQPKNNPWYNATSPNPSYSWGYDFNHE